MRKEAAMETDSEATPGGAPDTKTLVRRISDILQINYPSGDWPSDEWLEKVLEQAVEDLLHGRMFDSLNGEKERSPWLAEYLQARPHLLNDGPCAEKGG
jgi:hypothetical protein